MAKNSNKGVPIKSIGMSPGEQIDFEIELYRRYNGKIFGRPTYLAEGGITEVHPSIESFFAAITNTLSTHESIRPANPIIIKIGFIPITFYRDEPKFTYTVRINKDYNALRKTSTYHFLDRTQHHILQIKN